MPGFIKMSIHDQKQDQKAADNSDLEAISVPLLRLILSMCNSIFSWYNRHPFVCLCEFVSVFREYCLSLSIEYCLESCSSIPSRLLQLPDILIESGFDHKHSNANL